MFARNVLLVGIFIFGLGGGLGCAVSDDDRCPEGYKYNPETFNCSIIPLDSAVAKEAQASKEASATKAEAGAAAPTGLGTACNPSSGGAECTGFEANFCAGSGTTGSCTLKGCKGKNTCPTAYTCCDCSGVGSTDFCVSDAKVEQTKQYCTCETK